jgi:hypothetical protein
MACHRTFNKSKTTVATSGAGFWAPAFTSFLLYSIYGLLSKKTPGVKKGEQCVNIYLIDEPLDNIAPPMWNIRILFTNYDIITDFLNLAFCSERHSLLV